MESENKLAGRCMGVSANLRLVRKFDTLILERRGGTDAMGVTQWGKENECAVDITREGKDGGNMEHALMRWINSLYTYPPDPPWVGDIVSE